MPFSVSDRTDVRAPAIRGEEISPYWRLAPVLLVVLAAALRLWGIRHDLPFSFYGDELHMMKRAMAMGTGDLNPHWYHKPALLMYVLLATYGAMFSIGALFGAYESAMHFGAAFLHDHGPFLLAGRLVVVAFGLVTVYFTYRLARDVTGSRLGGLAAGTAAAIVPGLVDSGQHIKSDVPCAALMIASLSVFWRAYGSGDLKRKVLAGLLGGAAMGMHFYAIVLLPTYAMLEVSAALRARSGIREALRSYALLVLAFGVAMFAATPYTFLDPMGMDFVKTEGEGVNFIPDTQRPPFEAWWYPPAVHVLYVLATHQAFGPWLTLFACLGLAVLLRNRGSREAALLIGVPVISFVALAAVLTRYHAEPRHLSPFYAILAVPLWCGALGAGRWLAPRYARRVACALLVFCLVPSAATTVAMNRNKTRADSRVVAYHWIMSSLPRHDRVLLDDYGPQLPFSAAAIRRLQARLSDLPSSPFTAHQDQRLDLLSRFPADDGLDVEELGHQWWLRREVPDSELRNSLFHLDMGSPLVSRVPRTLDAYREEGFRWVVTNSAARNRYRRGSRDRDAFPSFAAFYDELPRGARLVRQFDPAEWGGKGPVVWIYDLGPGEID